MHLPVNSLLQGGKYKIVRFISSGGFGCTYEAEHVMLEKRVAIKEFFVKDFCNRDETSSHVSVGTLSKQGLVDKLRRKFIDEARALCKLQYPGIVGVSDVFEENGTAYFVMDYIEGRSLGDLLTAEGPMSEAQALACIRQVAAALACVHNHNRLHLDLKPGNIMIDREGNAVLIDFGASKQYDEMDGENTSTLIGKTPGYAPPEQMSNSVVKFLPATDIYALGATLYKMLTGITPPDANLRISGEDLMPLPETISAPTRSAVEAAMTINKNLRPQTIADFTALLDSPAEEFEKDSGEETLFEEDDSDKGPVKPEPPVIPEPPVKPEPPKPVPGGKSRNWFVCLWIWGVLLLNLALFALLLYVIYQQDDRIWYFRGPAICCVLTCLGCWMMWKHIRWGFGLFLLSQFCSILLAGPSIATLIGFAVGCAIAYGILQIRKNGVSAWKHMDYQWQKPGMLPAYGVAALGVLVAIVCPNEFAVGARNQLEPYREMVRECRANIEQGSQFDPQPLIDAQQQLQEIIYKENIYASHNSDYCESAGLKNALSSKAAAAADSWATAGDSQARVGNEEKALEFYTTALQLDNERAEIREKFEKVAAKYGYLKPTDLLFRGEGDYGETLYANQIKYLYLQMNYDSLDPFQSHYDVRVIVKLYVNGVLECNSSVYSSNYTYHEDIEVEPGSDRAIALPGWGTEEEGSYNTGTLRAEIWVGNKKLFTKTSTIH